DIRGDVHCGVADDDWTRIGRCCDEHAVAEETLCPKAVLPLQHCVHVLVGMETALHQRASLARASEIRGDSGRFLSIRGRNYLERLEVELCFCDNILDLFFGPNQYRCSKRSSACIDRASQRILTAWVDHRVWQRYAAF